MRRSDTPPASPLIGDLDDALLTEIRIVVAVIFALSCALLLGWSYLA